LTILHSAHASQLQVVRVVIAANRPWVSQKRNIIAPLATNDTPEDEKKPQGPAVRQGDHLKSARAALKAWRLKTKLSLYSPSPFTADTILPDPFLTTIASNAHIQTAADIAAVLKRPWMLLDAHGEEVLQVLRNVDQSHRQAVEAQRQTKLDESGRGSESSGSRSEGSVLESEAVRE